MSREDLMEVILSRYSVSPKHLAEPGPSEAEIQTVVAAALRAPDHGKIVPFRFVSIRGDGLARLAALFEDYGRRHGKSAEALQTERVRAMQAPVVLALIARIDATSPDIPAHEKWACVGGALSNALMAVHALGYAGKMLSGQRAADVVIEQAFCGEGEKLVGWISIGTPRIPPERRGVVDPSTVLSHF